MLLGLYWEKAWKHIQDLFILQSKRQQELWGFHTSYTSFLWCDSFLWKQEFGASDEPAPPLYIVVLHDVSGFPLFELLLDHGFVAWVLVFPKQRSPTLVSEVMVSVPNLNLIVWLFQQVDSPPSSLTIVSYKLILTLLKIRQKIFNHYRPL